MTQPSEEILAVINPHLVKFRQIPILAWKDYDAECEGIRHKITPSTRASIVRDNMIYHAKRLFADVKGVNYLQRGQLFLLIIDNLVSIKFKKLDGKMMPRYIPTQQALSYMNQVGIPGIPQVSKWVAGYRLNSLQSAIRDIFITYPTSAKSVPWHLELTPVIEKIVTPSIEETKERRKSNE